MLHLDLTDQRAPSPHPFMLLPRDISHKKKNGNNITLCMPSKAASLHSLMQAFRRESVRWKHRTRIPTSQQQVEETQTEGWIKGFEEEHGREPE